MSLSKVTRSLFRVRDELGDYIYQIDDMSREDIVCLLEQTSNELSDIISVMNDRTFRLECVSKQILDYTRGE